MLHVPNGDADTVSAREQPPWLGDASLWAVADRLEPLVVRDPESRYVAGEDARRLLAGEIRRPPSERWVGGVHLGSGDDGWAWDSERREIVRE